MKPTIAKVLDLWPAGEAKPSYNQARRFLRRLAEALQVPPTAVDEARLYVPAAFAAAAAAERVRRRQARNDARRAATNQSPIG